MLMPVLVIVTTFGVPVTDTVTLLLAATTTLLLPLINDTAVTAAIPVNELPLPIK